MKTNKKFLCGAMFMALAANSYSMHIMEGFLPPMWSGIWFALCIPFILLGIAKIKKKAELDSKVKMLIAMAGAFAFVLSALKIPSVTGSCSHPTGVGLAAILFGPVVTSVLGSIVLLFQSILLAHGGLSTLGANVFSMGIVGPIASYFIYRALRNSSKTFAVFMAAALGDLITYMVTSVELAVAYPDPVSGTVGSLIKFLEIFAITQAPLAISEGLITVIVFNILMKYNKETLDALDV